MEGLIARVYPGKKDILQEPVEQPGLSKVRPLYEQESLVEVIDSRSKQVELPQFPPISRDYPGKITLAQIHGITPATSVNIRLAESHPLAGSADTDDGYVRPDGLGE